MDLFNVDFPVEELRSKLPKSSYRTNDQFYEKFGRGPAQKCFTIRVKGLKDSINASERRPRIIYVFPTFIVTTRETEPGVMFSTVREHCLGNIGLSCLKLADFHNYSECPIRSVGKFEKDLELYRPVLEELKVHDRQAFEEEKVAQELKIVRQAFELEESRQALERDRQAFERERQDLERELARYKGIVGDCLKEIETYLE